jgi:hypothetical protein
MHFLRELRHDQTRQHLPQLRRRIGHAPPSSCQQIRQISRVNRADLQAARLCGTGCVAALIALIPACWELAAQCRQHGSNLRRRVQFNRHTDCVRRALQRVELAPQQRLRHVMVFSPTQPRGYGIKVAV